MTAFNNHKMHEIINPSFPKHRFPNGTILPHLLISACIDWHAYLSERFSRRRNIMFSGNSPPFIR